MADVEICRAWGSARGCRFAADCKFKHEGEQGGAARTRAPAAKNADEACKSWSSDRGCRHAEKCPYKHVGAGKTFVEKSDAEKAKEVCNNWKSAKGCKAGAECKYKHEGPTGKTDKPAAAAAAPKEGARPRRRRGGGGGAAAAAGAAPVAKQAAKPAVAKPAAAPKVHDPNEECNNWKSDKGCWKGAECNYKHIGKTGNPNPVKPERRPRRGAGEGAAAGAAATGAPRACRFFNTAEGCKQGKDCKFSHE